MGMRQELRMRQETRLTIGQKASLEQLLSLETVLRHPEIPNAAKGLEGIQAADTLLKERGAPGILIGGLAEEVWRSKKNLDDLNLHKDVDVLVLSAQFELEKHFENGIDWWLLKEKTFDSIRSSSGSRMTNVYQKWHENANGIILHFFINVQGSLDPGLHIPTPDLITEIRMNELGAMVDQSVGYDEEVHQAAQKKIRRRMTTRLMPEVKSAVVHIADVEHIESYSIPLDMYIAINEYHEQL